MPASVREENDVNVKVATENAQGDGATVEEEKPPAIGILGLFTFADTTDHVLIALGILSGIVSGVTLPLFSILLGGMYTEFNTAEFNNDTAELLRLGEKYAILFAWVAVAAAVAGAGQVAFFTITSERQTLRIRKLYLSSVLRQDISWFDSCKSGELTSKVAGNTIVIREAMGDKLGALFQFLSMFITGYIVGFYYSWKLTLVVLSAAPLLGLGGYFMMKTMADATSKSLGAYSQAGGIAEEAISLIRSVASFGLEKRIAKTYKSKLVDAEVEDIRKARGNGIGMGFTFGYYFLTYALAFWAGMRFVVNDMEKYSGADFFPPSAAVDSRCQLGTLVSAADQEFLQCPFVGERVPYTFTTNADICACIKCDCGCTVYGDCVNGGDIVLVFFSVIIASFSIGQSAPSITALMNGKEAAAEIWQIIHRIPDIDQEADTGLKPESLKGNVVFKDVKFRYPARKDVEVFSKLNLTLEPGQSVALVGGSGCGKSTVTQLLQRFYDPEDGQILIDGTDLKDLNISWWRDQIGLVGQEPVLFAADVATNIRYGVPSSAGDVSQDQIAKAAASAHADGFISEMPDGYETYIGERGSTLSGGQKQRIAIARAIIRDPSFLILDEATSALDSESERIVQAALDELLKSQQRTTLVIAHRLSTVKTCDKIVVLGGGEVMEQGSHDELLALGGHYAALVAAAKRSQESGGTDDLKDLAEKDPEVASRLASSELKPRKSAVSSLHENPAESGSDGATDDDDASDDEDSAAGNSTGKDGASKTSEPKEASMGRIFEFARPEKWWFAPGILAAAVNGAIMPIFAILFSGISNVFFESTVAQIEDEAAKFSLYFVGFSFLTAAGYFGQFYIFGFVGAKMTKRVRYETFLAILKQDVAFFDRKSHSVGALTSKLATDAALVRSALLDRLGLAVMNLVTIIAAFAIAFYYGWKLTLVLISMLPLIAIGGFFQMAMMAGLAGEDDKALSEASQVLSEAVAGIRTVTAFALRKRLVDLYDEHLSVPNKLGKKKGITAGLGFGFSQGIMFAVYSVAFFYGSRLMVYDDYSFPDVISVFFAIVMAGFGIGQSMSMAPDVGKASFAVKSVFKLLDRSSKVDPFSKEGLRKESETSGDISLADVDFAYPTRKEVKVFDKFSLDIKQGQTVALVGQSGSGKSTIVSLLERFYDVDEGKVLFHGMDVRSVNPAWLRTQIGFVSQEPALFKASIFENIAYGIPQENDDEDAPPVMEEEVIEACKKANAWDFIQEFPDGLQTDVGPRGERLSGGQRQRIVIARVLLRKPKVLLLDEATSALDNISEKAVQEAIDNMVETDQCTTIVIAHKLNVITNSDVIAVVDHGVIVEKGTHEELLAKDGIYNKLWTTQQKRRNEE